MLEKTIEITELGIGLSEWEFLILCNTCGIKDIVCFEQKMKEPSEEEGLQTLLDMVNRNLLIHSGDTFSLSEDILSVMEVIEKRKFTIKMRLPESDIPDCCFYIGDGENLILAEPGARENEYVVFKTLPKSVFEVFLESGGYIPKNEVSPEIQEIRRKVEYVELNGVEFTPFDGDAPNDYRFMAEVYMGDQDIKYASLYVLWDKGNEILIEVSEMGKVADYYSEERLVKELLQLVGL